MLRRTLVALVAFATALSLAVVTATPASADARSDLFQQYGVIPEDPSTYPPENSLTASQKVELICMVHVARTGQDCYVSGEVTMTPASAIGSASAVKAGTSLFAKLCRTGSRCQQLIAPTLALLGIGAVQAVDWAQSNPTATGLNPFGPSVIYAASNTTSPKGEHRYALWGHNYGQAIDINAGNQVCLSTWGAATTNATSHWRSSLVRKTTGAWIHLSGVDTHTVRPEGSGTCIDPSTASYDGSQYELRRFDIVGDSPVQTMDFTTGVAWGQDLVGSTDTFQSETRCLRPDGTEYSVTTPAVGQAAGGVNVAPCQSGDTPIWNQINRLDAAGNVYPQSVVNLRPRTTTPEGWATPACDAGGCRWTVKVDGQSCWVGAELCIDWTAKKSRSQCFFGPYEMPLDKCYWLERAYEVKAVPIPATGPNTDGDPSTHEGPSLNPQLQPQPSPSPTATTAPSPTTSASPAPNPSPTKNTNPSTDPSPRPTPSSTGSASPSPSPTPTPGGSGSPNPADPAAQQCFPTGWGVFNPVQWVLMPIRCAFEPDAGNARARVENLRQQFAERGIGPLIASVVKTVEAVPEGGGCEGPAYTFDVRGVHQTLHPFSACDEPMATVAEYGHALATLTLVISGGLAIIRAISTGFGFQFGMKGGGSSGD